MFQYIWDVDVVVVVLITCHLQAYIYFFAYKYNWDVKPFTTEFSKMYKFEKIDSYPIW